MAGKVIVVVGGQFGSEGKGAIAAYLSRTEPRPLLAIRVGGPNAGHTVYDANGTRFPLRQIPVAAVANPNADLAIAPGSEIDPEVLRAEITALEGSGYPVTSRLAIDTEATVLETHHRDAERGMHERLGSTGKGIGAARAERIMRRALTVREYDGDAWWERVMVRSWSNVPDLAATWLGSDGAVLIEGTQGFGLGLHAGYYPYCTSGDCRAIDFLSQAGISPWTAAELEVWVVLRTYPIRVAGNSGPMHEETTWEHLAEQTNGYIQPEQTTVTHKVRRVGNWDSALALRAIAANGGWPPVRIALTMYDYWFPELRDRTYLTPTERESAYNLSEGGLRDTPISLIGTGPSTVVDLR